MEKGSAGWDVPGLRHVFLTGDKGIGKSTLLKKILRRYDGHTGGFFTVRTNTFLPGEHTVHLFCADEEPVPGRDNLLFVCGKADIRTPERFELLGRRALDRCSGCSLIVMDELGPHEAQAVLFRQAVLRRLDGGTPVLGVLQAPAGAFWSEITGRPDVWVLEVTKHNREREELVERILSVIR